MSAPLYRSRPSGFEILPASMPEARQIRDGIYVSATENSLIEANLGEQVRFGVHYMYSYDNEVRDNVMNDNNHVVASFRFADDSDTK